MASSRLFIRFATRLSSSIVVLKVLTLSRNWLTPFWNWVTEVPIAVSGLL